MYNRVADQFRNDPQYQGVAPSIISDKGRRQLQAHTHYNATVDALGSDATQGKCVYDSFERPLDPT